MSATPTALAMPLRKPSCLALSLAILIAGCAIPALALAVYWARHVGVSARLSPASYGGYRNGLEPGDTVAIAGGKLAFPGLFGHRNVNLNSSLLLRWRSLDSISASHAVIEDGRRLRATTGGTFVAIPALLGTDLGVAYAEEFYVLPERIDSVVLHISRDTLQLGDTLVGSFEVRGVSGHVLTLCSPLINSTGKLDVQTPFNGCASELKGVAREVGPALIEMKVGHHRTVARVYVREAQSPR